MPTISCHEPVPFFRPIIFITSNKIISSTIRCMDIVIAPAPIARERSGNRAFHCSSSLSVVFVRRCGWFFSSQSRQNAPRMISGMVNSSSVEPAWESQCRAAALAGVAAEEGRKEGRAAWEALDEAAASSTRLLQRGAAIRAGVKAEPRWRAVASRALTPSRIAKEGGPR